MVLNVHETTRIVSVVRDGHFCKSSAGCRVAITSPEYRRGTTRLSKGRVNFPWNVHPLVPVTHTDTKTALIWVRTNGELMYLLLYSRLFKAKWGNRHHWAAPAAPPCGLAGATPAPGFRHCDFLDLNHYAADVSSILVWGSSDSSTCG